MPRHLVLSISKARQRHKAVGCSLLCGKAELPCPFTRQLAPTFFSLPKVNTTLFQAGEATPKLSRENTGFPQTSSTVSTTITICFTLKACLAFLNNTGSILQLPPPNPSPRQRPHTTTSAPALPIPAAETPSLSLSPPQVTADRLKNTGAGEENKEEMPKTDKKKDLIFLPFTCSSKAGADPRSGAQPPRHRLPTPCPTAGRAPHRPGPPPPAPRPQPRPGHRVTPAGTEPLPAPPQSRCRRPPPRHPLPGRPR